MEPDVGWEPYGRVPYGQPPYYPPPSRRPNERWTNSRPRYEQELYDRREHAHKPLQTRPLNDVNLIEGPAFGNDTASAFNNFAVVSALIFGFGVSVLSGIPGMKADVEDTLLLDVFALCLAAVCCLSAVCTAIMTLDVYWVTILSERCQQRDVVQYLNNTWHRREFVRSAIWYTLAAFLSSLALLCCSALERTYAIASTSTIIIGALSVVWSANEHNREGGRILARSQRSRNIIANSNPPPVGQHRVVYDPGYRHELY